MLGGILGHLPKIGEDTGSQQVGADKVRRTIAVSYTHLDVYKRQTVDRSMEEWNKKWFSKNNPDELSLPQEKNPIPDFLR